MPTPIDFCLHQIVRVRLVNATPAEVAVVERQIGALQAPARGEPDITIRFVDNGPDLSTMRILENWEAGYTSSSFWILRGNHGRAMAAHYPFEAFGEPCEITCCHGIDNLPLLQPIMNLRALAKGYLPLHASAFEYQGRSVLVTGWAQGGKTEALLGFADQGATYVGDEWIYISRDGQHMYGIPQPIHLWDWHLDAPQYRRRLTRQQRTKLLLTRWLQTFSESRPLRRMLGAKTARRVSHWIQRRRHARLTPEHLFNGRVKTSSTCPPELFLMASHAAQTVAVEPMAISNVVRCMAVSLEDEFSELLSAYRQFRFAFPQQRNPWLEQLPLRLEQQLEHVLCRKRAYAVWHPYPVSPGRLFLAMKHFVGAGTGACSLATHSLATANALPEPLAHESI